MRLLLDTHVLLWALLDSERLHPQSRAAIVDGRNEVLVSTASAWEITIKRGLGKLDAPHDLPEQLRNARFEVLPVGLAHALAVGELPDHHRDLFDRLLVAQARVEELTLVTADPALRAYDVPTLPA